MSLLVLLAVSLAALVRAPAGVAATEPVAVFQGNAWGTFITVNGVAQSGRTALAAIGCATSPTTSSNSVTNVDAAPLLTTAQVRSVVSGREITGGVQTLGQNDIETVSILDGLITADAVRAVARATKLDGASPTAAAGSRFVGLKIGDTAVSTTVAPNTKIDLPGLGHVVLNQQQVFRPSASTIRITVTAIVVVITESNALGILPGTKIFVSSTTAGVGQVSGTLSGRAYGTFAKLGTTILDGPRAAVWLPCTGTSGLVIGTTVASVSVPDVLTTGTSDSIAQGDVSLTSAYGITRNETQMVDLLKGVVTADVVKAQANVAFDGTTLLMSSSGSGFVNLKVAGHPAITDDVPRNTKVEITGVGTLWLNRVVKTKNRVVVTMIELHIKSDNTLGLPSGIVRVGVAEAGFKA